MRIGVSVSMCEGGLALNESSFPKLSFLAIIAFQDFGCAQMSGFHFWVRFQSKVQSQCSGSQRMACWTQIGDCPALI